MNAIRLVTRYPLRSTAAALGVVAAICGGLVWMASGQLIHPFWHEPGLEPVGPEDIAYETWSGVQHPSEFALAYEEVEFSAVDGDTLRGWWIPLEGARGAVVTVHGGGSDRRDFVRHVPFLRRAGFSVLLFDCREHGRSDGRGRGISGGYRESEDVSSAVSFLGERGVDHVSVLGTSQGASSALIAAVRDRRIRAVVAENPVASLDTLVRKTAIIEQLNLPELLLAAIPRVAFSRIGARGGGWEALDLVSRVSPTPILFIHGLADVVTPPYHTELLMEAANQPKAVWWVPDGEHMRLYNRAPEEYERRVVKFLESVRRVPLGGQTPARWESGRLGGRPRR